MNLIFAAGLAVNSEASGSHFIVHVDSVSSTDWLRFVAFGAAAKSSDSNKWRQAITGGNSAAATGTANALLTFCGLKTPVVSSFSPRPYSQ
ncbi:hypothetical protein [Novipirellula caenicola]|uniref:hypothetical protein n=1 Tax=Novipirellula caenicola TaxID=1536901 RepID=UPI0031ED38CB